jgi:hypothetical protein
MTVAALRGFQQPGDVIQRVCRCRLHYDTGLELQGSDLVLMASAS